MASSAVTLIGGRAFQHDWIKILEAGVAQGKGRIAFLQQANPAVLIYSPDGRLLDSWGDQYRCSLPSFHSRVFRKNVTARSSSQKPHWVFITATFVPPEKRPFFCPS